MKAAKDKPTPRRAATTFERLNALADTAYEYSDLEVKIMLKAISHANNQTGDVTLSVASFAKCAGTDRRQAQRVLARLAVKGVLPVVRSGGGRNITATRRPQLPFIDRTRREETAVVDTTVSNDGNSGSQAQETAVAIARNSGSHLHKTAVATTAGTSHRTSFEHLNSNSSGIAAADFPDDGGKGRREALEAIHDSGIQEPTASKLIEQFPTITAADVQTLMAGMSASAGAGARVEAIRTNAGRIIDARSSQQHEHRARIEAAERARGQIADATANVKACREAAEAAKRKADGATTRRDEAARAWIQALPETDLESIAAARRESDPTIRSLCTAARLRIASAMTLDIVVELWAASAPEQAASFVAEVQAAKRSAEAAKLESDRTERHQQQLQRTIDSVGDAPRSRYCPNAKPRYAGRIEIVNGDDDHLSEKNLPTAAEVEAIL